MNLSVAEFVLTLVLYIVPVIYCVLVPGFSIQAGNGNLPEDALVMGILALILLPPCWVGLFKFNKGRKEGSAPKPRVQWPWRTAVAAVLSLHVSVTAIMIAEAATNDCDEDIFALCTADKENFWAMIAICVTVQCLFLVVEFALMRITAMDISTVTQDDFTIREYDLAEADLNFDARDSAPEAADPQNIRV